MLIDQVALRRAAALRLVKIVKMRDNGATFDEIGRKFRISRQRVDQILKREARKAG